MNHLYDLKQRPDTRFPNPTRRLLGLSYFKTSYYFSKAIKILIYCGFSSIRLYICICILVLPMEGSMQKTPSSSSSSSVSGCSSSSYCCSMSGSRNTVNAVLLAGFRELFNRTEDQSDDNSVSSSQNQPVLPTGLEQSAVPDAQFSTSFSPNNIWAWPGLRNEGITLLNFL